MMCQFKPSPSPQNFLATPLSIMHLQSLANDFPCRHHLERVHDLKMADNERIKLMENALVELCVSDSRPFSLINGKGFVFSRCIFGANVRFTVISERCIVLI